PKEHCAMSTFPNLPGVQIQEVLLGSPPIAGVGTSTAGFVGKAPDAAVPADSAAMLIPSYDQFKSTYVNAPTRTTQLSRAVRGFFGNGGTECYIVNVKVEGGGAPNPGDTAAIEAGVDLLGQRDDIEIIAAPGSWSKSISDYLSTQAKNLGDRVAILDSP